MNAARATNAVSRTRPPHTAPNPIPPSAMFTAARETAGSAVTGSGCMGLMA